MLFCYVYLGVSSLIVTLGECKFSHSASLLASQSCVVIERIIFVLFR